MANDDTETGGSPRISIDLLEEVKGGPRADRRRPTTLHQLLAYHAALLLVEKLGDAFDGLAVVRITFSRVGWLVPNFKIVILDPTGTRMEACYEGRHMDILDPEWKQVPGWEDGFPARLAERVYATFLQRIGERHRELQVATGVLAGWVTHTVIQIVKDGKTWRFQDARGNDVEFLVPTRIQVVGKALDGMMPGVEGDFGEIQLRGQVAAIRFDKSRDTLHPIDLLEKLKFVRV